MCMLMLTIHIAIGFGNPYVRVEVGRKVEDRSFEVGGVRFEAERKVQVEVQVKVGSNELGFPQLPLLNLSLSLNLFYLPASNL